MLSNLLFVTVWLLLVSKRGESTSCLHPSHFFTINCFDANPPHLLSLSDTGVHVGEPVFDAVLTEGGREGGVKMDRGEGGEREMRVQGFSPHTHTHTHEHTHPHPHLAAGLLPSSLPSAGMSA